MVINPQRWTMMPRQDCAEGGRAATGRMLIELVVQDIVDDFPAPHAFQLVSELLDPSHDFSGRFAQGSFSDGWP